MRKTGLIRPRDGGAEEGRGRVGGERGERARLRDDDVVDRRGGVQVAIGEFRFP